jgi:two-component system chemotaxis response regulator CheY
MARVLIVDDALIMRRILGTLLEKSGHEVVGNASNANEAKALYQELHPDLVTMDILMEGADGVTCLKQIIQTDPDARVIMITAQGHGQLERQSRAAGARGFVAKPIEQDALQAEVQNALSD